MTVPGATLLASASLLLLSLTGANDARSAGRVSRCAALDPASTFRQRVAPPSAAILATYRGSGAKNVRPHRLTAAEWAKVDAAFAALPPAHRDVLRRHLRRISFVASSAGGGNALTSPAEPECGGKLFDITLRAGLLDETLTTFLTTKEAMLFVPDGSGTTVRIDAGTTSAVHYVLLHEAAHVVDGALGLSVAPTAAFRQGVWRPGEERALAAAYASNPVNGIAWRGGPRRPIGRAAELYRGLSETPFVSLYASASAGEDLAEIAAWQQLGSRGIRPVVDVRRGDGSVAFRYSPLEADRVRERLARFDAGGSLTAPRQ